MNFPHFIDIPFLTLHGLLFDLQRQWGMTPMHTAATFGEVQVCRVMMDAGVPFDRTNGGVCMFVGLFALCSACKLVKKESG